MTITSRANPVIVAAAALKEKKYREQRREFMLEGVKLFREATASRLTLTGVFAIPTMVPVCREIAPEAEITEVSEPVLEKLSSEKSPEGVICTAKYLDKIHIINKIYKEKDFSIPKKRMILASLRDPGNLGTVIRSAAAFGVDELILSGDCADLYHPRTVRGAMGTLFRQRIVRTDDLVRTVGELKRGGCRLYAAVLDEAAVRLDRLAIGRDTVFIIGNEGHGIDPAIVRAAGGTVWIPMADGVESLNAAAAAAVFLWQSACAETSI